ncbi:MAG: hypothetical protein ABJB16_19040 [Saprospiraceae bacterium]
MNRNLDLGTGILIFLVLSICAVGCDLINPTEAIPLKIKLERFDLQTLPGQGSDQNKITEVWVYADSSFLGIFSPPVEIPFLADKDQTQFIFHPGIRNNGLAQDPIIYPLYTPYEITLTTSSGNSLQINPITHYKPETVVSLNADFETSNEFVDNRDTIAGSFVTRTMIGPFEGNYCGEIILTDTANYIEVGNAIAMGDLPTNGKSTYLEFQYKSEMEMSIGILGISLTGEKFSNFFYLVKPSENWNMLYIDLTDKLSASDFPAYKILFRSLYPSNATKPELKIQLDNVKVVHL